MAISKYLSFQKPKKWSGKILLKPPSISQQGLKGDKVFLLGKKKQEENENENGSPLSFMKKVNKRMKEDTSDNDDDDIPFPSSSIIHEKKKKSSTFDDDPSNIAARFSKLMNIEKRKKPKLVAPLSNDDEEQSKKQNKKKTDVIKKKKISVPTQPFTRGLMVNDDEEDDDDDDFDEIDFNTSKMNNDNKDEVGSIFSDLSSLSSSYGSKRKGYDDDNLSLAGMSSSGRDIPLDDSMSILSGESVDRKKNNNSSKENEEVEKTDLLTRFHYLKQRGVHLAKNYTMKSSLSEMRMEMGRIEHEAQVSKSIQTNRRILFI